MDYFFNAALRSMWYAAVFIVWVIKAFLVIVAKVSNHR